jgi:hypothetical protein
MNPTAPFWMGAGLSLLVFFPAILLVRQQDGMMRNIQKTMDNVKQETTS